MPIKNILERKRKEMERKRKKEAARKMGAGFTIGAIIGAAAGVLFAPKSGKETREELITKTKDTTENLKEAIKNTSLEDLKDKGEVMVTKIKDSLKETKGKKEIIIDRFEDLEEDEAEDTEDIVI